MYEAIVQLLNWDGVELSLISLGFYENILDASARCISVKYRLRNELEKLPLEEQQMIKRNVPVMYFGVRKER